VRVLGIVFVEDYFFSSAGLSDLKKSPIEDVVESQAELIEAQPVKHKAVNITEIKVRDLSVRSMTVL
jgi:hypothetical protein